MIKRLQLESIQKTKKSILLLGPRQVGKSTLINSLKPDLKINFADEQTLVDFAMSTVNLPDLVERRSPKTIFIDEVQRLPSILNTVQSLIDENKHIKFFLSGSSARKLKRGGANLLPGRVINHSLGPIIFRELDYKYDLKLALKYGFLPEALTTKSEEDKRDLLTSYATNYIKEEIQAEALTRSLESFARFLSEVTQSVGLFVDYTKIANRAKISRHTCPNFFEILEDTMIAFRVFPDPNLFDRLDLVKHPKFFFFDVGVFNGIERSFDLSSKRLGALMEQLVFQQILHSAQALRKAISIHTFRTRGGLEVDFLIHLDGQTFLIEVKSSQSILDSEAEPLILGMKHLPKAKAFIFHGGRTERKINGVWALPIANGLREMGL